MQTLSGDLVPRICDLKSKENYEVSKQTQRLPLNQINKSLDELNENSSQVYTKAYLNLNNPFSKTRMNVISNKCVFEDKDVFDTKSKTSKEKKTEKKTDKEWKKAKELEEVMTLMNELKEQKQIQKKFEEEENLELLDLVKCLKDIEEYENFCDKFSAISICEEDSDKSLGSRIINIKVKYRTQIKKFQMKPKEQFYTIMESMAEWTKADISDLIFRLNDKIIDVESTPLSVGFKVTDIIYCYKNDKHCDRTTDDPNIVTFRLRDNNGCEDLIKVNKFDRVCKIMSKYSKLKDIPFYRFKFEFDRQRLDRESRINEINLKDYSLINVLIN
jgi:hypothetical protein